jgi:hypothetical protein
MEFAVAHADISGRGAIDRPSGLRNNNAANR